MYSSLFQVYHKYSDWIVSLRSPPVLWIIYYFLFEYVDFYLFNNLNHLKFPVKDFFSKCEQIHSSLRICSHLSKTPLMKNFIFRTVFAVLELIFGLKFIPFKCTPWPRE